MKSVSAQLAISNGVSIPTRDTLRVLVILAEVDFSSGNCPNDLPESFGGNWTKDSRGRTLAPKESSDFFDVELKHEQKPKGFITDYYHQASFGQYVILGDYFPYAVTIPCNEIKIGGSGINQVLTKINKWTELDSNDFTAHHLPLKAFDNWSMSAAGQVKPKIADGKTDLIYIVWRNNRFITTANTSDNSGYGVSAGNGPAFLNSKGINNFASFNSAQIGRGSSSITIAEHLHGIFGGNNWHSSGGRGIHTFPGVVASYGLTGQLLAAMQGPSGWDRQMMEWKSPEKQFLTSCLDEKGNELNTENYTIDSFPKGGTYILRDFMTSGDAIRIKLPHINWTKKGDVKNQYLWLENRRMNTTWDEWYTEECADNGEGQFLRGTPGIYAYLQVGKDQKQGGSELYTSSPEYPNALASPFFPVTGEGNFDFYFDFDRVQEAAGVCGNWGNKNIPIDKKRSKPNPFTGSNDLYIPIDSDRDGKILSGDNVKTGLSEIIRDSVVNHFYENGDWEDAFSFANNHTEISISTNPAPTPVYTLATDLEYKNVKLLNGKAHSWENRTIWLNGLHIEIIDDNYKNKGDVKLQIRWDDYTVNDDVRWCGSIVLSPNDFDTTKASLILAPGNTLILDQATSVTWPYELKKNKDGIAVFSEPTKFTILPSAKMEVGEKSTIVIDNNSELILKSGSRLKLEHKSKIIIKNGGKLTKEYGATLIVEKNAKIIEK